MADSPVRLLVKIGDPTTAANEAAVNASGELTVIEASGAGILTSVQLIDDAIFIDDTDTHATGSTKGMGIMAVAVPTDAAVAANDIGMPAMSLDRRLLVDADITASVALDVSAATVTVSDDGSFVVDLGANNDVTIEGGAVLGTDGAAGPANALSIGGTESGGNFQEILVDATGALQVDVLSGGGETVPTGEVRVHASSTDTAVDASLTIDEAEAGGTTSKLRGFDASASVPIKAEIIQVDDAVETVRNVLFAAAGEPIIWRAPHRNYYSFAFTANAGFDGWRIKVTNKDSTDAADLYGTIYTEN